jgi:hypothetical protein
MDPSNIMDFEESESSPFADNNDENLSSTQNINESSSQEREAVMRNTATQLEAILNDLKGTTQRLLEEMGIYMEAAEGVSVDYTKCQESQRNEARRLAEVQPDVEGATHRFIQQAQVVMATTSHRTTSPDGDVDLEEAMFLSRELN